MGNILIQNKIGKRELGKLFTLLSNGGIIPLSNKLGIKVDIEQWHIVFSLFALDSTTINDNVILHGLSATNYAKTRKEKEKVKMEKADQKKKEKEANTYRMSTGTEEEGW